MKNMGHRQENTDKNLTDRTQREMKWPRPLSLLSPSLTVFNIWYFRYVSFRSFFIIPAESPWLEYTINPFKKDLFRYSFKHPRNIQMNTRGWTTSSNRTRESRDKSREIREINQEQPTRNVPFHRLQMVNLSTKWKETKTRTFPINEKVRKTSGVLFQSDGRWLDVPFLWWFPRENQIPCNACA